MRIYNTKISNIIYIQPILTIVFEGRDFIFQKDITVFMNRFPNFISLICRTVGVDDPKNLINKKVKIEVDKKELLTIINIEGTNHLNLDEFFNCH